MSEGRRRDGERVRSGGRAEWRSGEPARGLGCSEREGRGDVGKGREGDKMGERKRRTGAEGEMERGGLGEGRRRNKKRGIDVRTRGEES